MELLVGDNYSHLELPETLCNPYGLLGAAVLAQMGLAQMGLGPDSYETGSAYSRMPQAMRAPPPPSGAGWSL